MESDLKERRRYRNMCWILLAIIVCAGCTLGLISYLISWNITRLEKDGSPLLKALVGTNKFVLDESSIFVSVITAGIFALIAARVLDDLNVGGIDSQINRISPVVLFLATCLAYVTAGEAIVLALTAFAPLQDSDYSAFFKSIAIYLYCAILLVVSVAGPYARTVASESNELSKIQVRQAATEIVDSLEPGWDDCGWSFKELVEFTARVTIFALVPTALVFMFIVWQLGIYQILLWLILVFFVIYAVTCVLVVLEFNKFSRILRRAYRSNQVVLVYFCLNLALILLISCIYVAAVGAWAASIFAILFELAIIVLARKILWNDQINKRMIFNLVRYDEELQNELMVKGKTVENDSMLQKIMTWIKNGCGCKA